MAKRNFKKPSKRGKKAKRSSLHCSSRIKTNKSWIKKWSKHFNRFYKILDFLLKFLKIFEYVKSLLEWF